MSKIVDENGLEKAIKVSLLTQERLMEVLYYTPETGVWTWKVSTNRSIKVGSRAGCVSKRDGYRKIRIDGVLHTSARLAFLYIMGGYPTEADHINRIRHDDRWENLRDVTRQRNTRNQGINSTNTSGATGVSLHKHTGKWQAYIAINGKQIYLGHYEEFHDAVMARYCVELKYNWSVSNPSTSAKQYVDKHFNRARLETNTIAK